MAKKPTKKVTRKVSSRRDKHATPAPSTPPPAPAAPTVAPVKTRPTARFHRAHASPAQRRGAELVRFLRIHAKRPYGRRGEANTIALAREVAHLARIELGEVKE